MNQFCPYCGRKDHGFACAGLLGIEPPPEPEEKPGKPKPSGPDKIREPGWARRRPRTE